MAERINKYLSSHGVCSRREADRLIERGSVLIDGNMASLGTLVNENSIVSVDGKVVSRHKPDDILLAFNKPIGIVCTTTDNQGKNNIVDYIGYKERIYPVGRLDKDSCGLILMTNNGDLMDRILRSVNEHEKEYIVKVNKRIDDAFLIKLSKGVYLHELDRTTKACKVEKISEKCFRIVLTQGLNRQIRRMCEELSYKVTELTRIRIMNIELNDLKTGEYREVTGEEKEILLRDIYK